MEKTDKSAEDLLRSVGNGVISKSVAIKSMHEFADQQLSEYKERLKNSLLSWASVGRGKDSEDLINDIVILIDKLQPTSSEQSGHCSENSNNL